MSDGTGEVGDGVGEGVGEGVGDDVGDGVGATAPATVRRYGPGGTQVLLDDGTAVAVPAAAVDPGLRHLRPGQRVRLHSDPDGAVIALTLPGGPLPTAAG